MLLHIEQSEENDKARGEVEQEMIRLERIDLNFKQDLKEVFIEQGELERSSTITEKDIKQLESNINEYNIKIPEMETEINKLKEKADLSKQSYLDSIPKEIDEYKKNLDSLKDKKQPLMFKLNKFQNDLERLQEIVEGINLKQEEREIKDAEQDVIREKQNMDKLEKDYQEICVHFEQESVTKIDQAKEMISQLTQQKDQLINEYRAITSQIEEYNRDSGAVQNKVLDEVFRCAENGQLKGVIGRLGDLGAIDEKFDIAISTGCAMLNSIVVQTMNDATEIMNYLRRNKIGTAHILSLDQVSSRIGTKMDAKFDTPRNSKRLFDLVKPSQDEFRCLFYKALADTLVTDNIENASIIAYGERRYKVVTLTGEVIEKTGIATGGGKPRKGLMGNKSRKSISTKDKNQLSKLNSQQHEIQNEINKIDQKMQECNDQISYFNSPGANAHAKAFKTAYPVHKREIQSRLIKAEEELENANTKYNKAFKNKQDKE